MKQSVVEFEVYIDFSSGYPTGIDAGDSAAQKVSKAIDAILEAGVDNKSFTFTSMDIDGNGVGALLTHDNA